tara:strand:- start:533 stop:790 length:258 start_codon:yes stop_codon:yes gene_type:complete
MRNLEKEFSIKGINYNVGWNEETSKGWFELYDEGSGGDYYYAEGGLWFEGKELVDYDGVFELDDEVIKCLEDWGADISYVQCKTN